MILNQQQNRCYGILLGFLIYSRLEICHQLTLSILILAAHTGMGFELHTCPMAPFEEQTPSGLVYNFWGANMQFHHYH